MITLLAFQTSELYQERVVGSLLNLHALKACLDKCLSLESFKDKIYGLMTTAID